jgi:TRAP-type transport system small permease protein
MSKICDILENILERFIGLLVGMMSFLLIAQVVTRFIFRGSMYWAGEMATWIFVWITYLGMALLYKRKNHIVVNLIDSIVTKKTKKYLETFNDIVVVIFLAAIFFYSIPVVNAHINQTAISVHISKSLLFISLPVSLGLIFLFFLDKIIRNTRGK